jgi:hypothetical protein
MFVRGGCRKLFGRVRYNSVDGTVQIASEDSGLRVSFAMKGSRQKCSLAHAPVILLGAEEAMDKDNGVLFGVRLLSFVEVVGELQLCIDGT